MNRPGSTNAAAQEEVSQESAEAGVQSHLTQGQSKDLEAPAPAAPVRQEWTREQIESKRQWWLSKINGTSTPLAEELAHWRSEVAVHDLALRGLNRPSEEERCILKEAKL